MATVAVTLVSIDALPVGVALEDPIFDARQTMLLAGGVEITRQLLRSLRRRSIEHVYVSQHDLTRLQAPVTAMPLPTGTGKIAHPEREHFRFTAAIGATQELDLQLLSLPSLEKLTLQHAGDPFALQLKKPTATPYDQALLRHLAESHERGVRHMTAMIENFVAGDLSELTLIGGIVGDKLDQATDDFDAFVCVGANPFSSPYPSRHALHTAMLAMAIGARMGLDQQTLIELGIGCWIHDVGMACVDSRLIEAERLLAANEFVEIAKHPIKTFEVLERNLDVIPAAARMVAYQIHERADGSGYPRGRTLAQTHPLARIAAVADTYAALVAPRPHRPGLQPYYAIEKILADAKRGLFDPKAVRGLLQTVGLFPIGSFVAFNHPDYFGRVIRVNGSAFGKPIVEVRHRGSPSQSPAIVDLSLDADLVISNPIPPIA